VSFPLKFEEPTKPAMANLSIFDDLVTPSMVLLRSPGKGANHGDPGRAKAPRVVLRHKLQAMPGG